MRNCPREQSSPRVTSLAMESAPRQCFIVSHSGLGADRVCPPVPRVWLAVGLSVVMQPDSAICACCDSKVTIWAGGQSHNGFRMGKSAAAGCALPSEVHNWGGSPAHWQVMFGTAACSPHTESRTCIPFSLVYPLHQPTCCFCRSQPPGPSLYGSLGHPLSLPPPTPFQASQKQELNIEACVT